MQILVEEFTQHVILGEFVLHLLSFHVIFLDSHVTVDVLLISVQSLLPVACVLLRPVTILVDDIQSIAPLAQILVGHYQCFLQSWHRSTLG